MAPILLKRFMERQNPEPRRQDPYRSKTKYEGMPRCPSCRAVFIHAQWVAEKKAREEIPLYTRLPSETCPACLQLKDRYAMGVVEIHGDRWRDLEREVLGTIQNTEKIARFRNDQQRVLWSQTYRNVT